MVLTDFGQTVLRHAQQIAAEIEATVALTENRRAEPTGQLRISMPGDFTQDMIGKILAGFIAQYPGVNLDIDVSQRRVDIISENFDLALRMGSLPDDSTLTTRQIGAFGVGLFASPQYLAEHKAIHNPQDLLHCAALKLQGRSNEVLPWRMYRNG
jgi:DNA-binding transcriptional LysR family regulator